MNRTPSPIRSRALTALLAGLVALATLIVGTPSAQAADSYVYWGYWQLSGAKWTFSQVGANAFTPADGAVEGWRFGIDDGGTGARPPRLAPSFQDLCGTTPAEAGKKRVGLVVDFGRAADGDGSAAPQAPLTTCVVVPAAATGADLLARAGGVRTEKTFICAIGGYPATGCSRTLATLTPEQKAPDAPLTVPTAAPTASAAAPSAAAPTAAATTAATGAAAATSAGGTSPTIWVVLFLAAAVLAFALARRRRPTGV